MSKKSLTNPLIDELRVEATLTGYLMSVLDTRDIIIALKKEFPEAEKALFELNDRLDIALRERKVLSMNVKESDLTTQ